MGARLAIVAVRNQLPVSVCADSAGHPVESGHCRPRRAQPAIELRVRQTRGGRGQPEVYGVVRRLRIEALTHLDVCVDSAAPGAVASARELRTLNQALAAYSTPKATTAADSPNIQRKVGAGASL